MPAASSVAPPTGGVAGAPGRGALGRGSRMGELRRSSLPRTWFAARPQTGSGDAEAAAAAAADMPADGFFFAPRRFAGIPLIPSLQARETVDSRTQDGQPSVQADREGSFGLPRRRGAIYARGCQGHKGGTRGQILSARYARATTLARVCGGGRQGWRRPDCRAPYLPSGLIARAHRASWSTCGVGGRGRGAQRLL